MKKYTREISAHLPWRIISTKPFFPKSCRSRTLDALVVPNTPTLWIKTPPPSTQHGAKRVPRTQSSLNRRQLGYEMYLNGHLPRSGKLLKSSTIYSSSCGTQGGISASGPSFAFTIIYMAPAGPTCETGQTQSLKVLCEVWTHAEKPTEKHCQGRIKGSPLRTISEKSSTSSLLWLPIFTWDCSKFLFPALSLG